MIGPDRLEFWYAQAVLRVYGPWLTSACVGISERQRREVGELIDRARRAAALPPLAPLVPAPLPLVVSPAPLAAAAPAPATPAPAAPGTAAAQRTQVGRWARAAA